MRPQGEVRVALFTAVQQLASGGGAVNFRQAAAAACVGTSVAEVTLRNMARAGQIAKVGHEKPAGGTHYFALYAMPDDAAVPSPWGGIEALADVMHRFSGET